MKVESHAGVTLFPKLYRMETFWSRARGLLNKRAISETDAYWIRPCSSVHSFGMRFAIDVVFLDEEFTVLGLVKPLRPWRCVFSSKAKSVLELRAGQCDAKGICVGQKLRFIDD